MARNILTNKAAAVACYSAGISSLNLSDVWFE